MNAIKGPAIFLAQFIDDRKPFNSLDKICSWAASLGYKGIQIPTWDSRVIDLEQAAASQDYCDELLQITASHDIAITELSTHLQGQLIAVHPAYNMMFDGFAPTAVKGNESARREWAVSQLKAAATASRRLGLTAHATFSGSLLWHTVYPWPQRPQGLVEEGFKELAQRWLPILDHFNEEGVDLCYEIHPGEDLHDGISFERFLEKINNHDRAQILFDPSHMLLQQMDYLTFIDIYHDRIKMFHVKDAEFRPSGRQGVYGGYSNWVDRAGRFRSLGDGQVDFKAIFSKLTQYGFQGWAVMEWECCIKSPQQGAKEGAPFINRHIIEVTTKAFDDFAGTGKNPEHIRNILGL